MIFCWVDMKCYSLAWQGKRVVSGIIDLGYELHLPRVHCHRCGSTWGDGMYEYPAFQFEFLNEEEFNFARVVDIQGFESIKRRIEAAAGRPVELVPGGSIGKPVGKTQSRLSDFTWGRVTYPQISRNACEILRTEGIHLLTADIDLQKRGKKVDSHLALQIEPAAMLTEESKSLLKITHCEFCGDFNQTSRTQRPPEGLTLRRAAWPDGRDLITVQETLDVIVSDRFVEVVKKNAFTGLEFHELGRLI